ncbi:MAG: general secretion pathway protein GspB [Desulfobacterales bacterium]|nr:general secretion pathway protein GspB [Desulfobacterales bacterium]
MSTILKALKRVDQTTPPPDDLQAGPLIIDTKDAVRGRVFRIWLQRKVVLALILFAVVIAAGWLIYTQKDRLLAQFGSQHRPDKPPVFQAKIEPQPDRSQLPGPRPAEPLRRQKKLSEATPERERSGTSQGSTGSLQRRLGQENQTKPMTATAPQTRAPEVKTAAKPDISRRTKADIRGTDQGQTRFPAAVPAQKSPTGADRDTRSYQRLDDDRLKLQAIAWSKVASQRIAVINDRIVREGESIEGFSINQIRQEDVIVNDGSQTWQLEFGLR